MKQTSHPFSTDHFLHGGDYNPDQWLDRPDILEKDLEYFEKAGTKLGEVRKKAQEGLKYYEKLEKISSKQSIQQRGFVEYSMGI